MDSEKQWPDNMNYKTKTPVSRLTYHPSKNYVLLNKIVNSMTSEHIGSKDNTAHLPTRLLPRSR